MMRTIAFPLALAGLLVAMPQATPAGESRTPALEGAVPLVAHQLDAISAGGIGEIWTIEDLLLLAELDPDEIHDAIGSRLGEIRAQLTLLADEIRQSGGELPEAFGPPDSAPGSSPTLVDLNAFFAAFVPGGHVISSATASGSGSASSSGASASASVSTTTMQFDDVQTQGFTTGPSSSQHAVTTSGGSGSSAFSSSSGSSFTSVTITR